jgi:tetratricopeptide (TPR) repeat protein
MRGLLATLLFAALPALAAERWTRIATPDFELLTTSGEKQGRETLRHFEQVREFFLKASPVRGTAEFPVRIIQFDTAEQYGPYRPQDFNIAYFVSSPAHDYIVLGDRASQDRAASIHEYMHLIVRRSGLTLPAWLNEGWADVYSTLRPMGKLGKEAAVGDLLPERMKSLATEQWLDFDELTSVDTRSPVYHEASRIGIFYAESWALAHMLYLSPEYKDNFGKFVMALDRGKSASDACKIAFGRSSNAVFHDLRTYFDRKKIYGRVFETGLNASHAEAVPTYASAFDSSLVLADLLAALGRPDEASREYARLEKEKPESADLALSIGNLAYWRGDRAAARRYFERVFDAGGADPRMCLELASLEREEKQPVSRIVAILERAVQSKPDYTEAKIQLGLTKADARDFPGAIAVLIAIPEVSPDRAPPVFCALAYAYIEMGDIAAAREHAATCRKWARTDSDKARGDKLLKFIEARSGPSAAMHAGEKHLQLTGVARAVECSAEGNRLRIAVADKLVTLDLPPPDAIELPAAPRNAFTFECGPQKPIPIAVEYAPPRSAMENAIGIVRRLDF